MTDMISIKNIISEVRNSNFTLNCKMPMKYTTGLPILSIRCERLCCVIPFLSYKITGESDKTEVYPVRYTITVLLPEGKIVGFEDLSVNPVFEDVDFDGVAGFFRHEAIKNLDKKAYNEKRGELYELYDRMINAILYNGKYTQNDDERFSKLISLLLEPSQKPLYKLLDEDFYNKYIS